MENSAFFCEIITAHETNQPMSLNIIVINTLKNTNEIDFENSKIKETPLKIIQIFGNIYYDKDLELRLNNFINSPGYINGEFEETNKYSMRYANKPDIHLRPSNGKRLYNFLKLSEYFYTYIFILNEKFKRIDWIYSKNFDNIFIGIVKNNKSYIKTFLYKVNSIDKLGMQKKNDIYTFKIIFKDQNSEEICQFKNEQNNVLFDQFLFLFNGRLEDINGIKTSDELAPPTIL